MLASTEFVSSMPVYGPFSASFRPIPSQLRGNHGLAPGVLCSEVSVRSCSHGVVPRSVSLYLVSDWPVGKSYIIFRMTSEKWNSTPEVLKPYAVRGDIPPLGRGGTHSKLLTPFNLRIPQPQAPIRQLSATFSTNSVGFLLIPLVFHTIGITVKYPCCRALAPAEPRAEPRAEARLKPV